MTARLDAMLTPSSATSVSYFVSLAARSYCRTLLNFRKPRSVREVFRLSWGMERWVPCSHFPSGGGDHLNNRTGTLVVRLLPYVTCGNSAVSSCKAMVAVTREAQGFLALYPHLTSVSGDAHDQDGARYTGSRSVAVLQCQRRP